MSDTTRNLPEAIDPAVGDTLLRKRDALLAERADIRKNTAALAQRDREIDRDLADLQAAGRVFGITVDLPKEQQSDGGDILRSWDTTVSTLRNLAKVFPAAAPPAAKAVATKAEMPRVSDIVLDRLKVAGKTGSKAAPIQAYIESTYSTKIHDKTVGMTLYRLQKERRVRRRGHTWFIAPETMNPGVAAPGLVTEKH